MSGRSAAAPPPGGELASRVRAGNRVAIARAISAVEAGAGDSHELLRSLRRATGRARLFGVTGAPGVGKSTLVGALIAELRKRNQTVGVIAVDPSSPISGGAILGDRVRMTRHGEDDGVFIRSLASRGNSGGLSLATSGAAEVLDAAGFENVIIETVGAGQSEIDVADLADVTAVVCAPGLGDDVQAMKAGLLEVADVLVVNKADDPLAAVTANQLESMLALRKASGRKVPVLKTSARDAVGIPELADALARTFEGLEPKDRARRRLERMRRLLAAVAGGMVARKLQASRAKEMEQLLGRLVSGRVDVEAAALEILSSDVWRRD